MIVICSENENLGSYLEDNLEELMIGAKTIGEGMSKFI